MKNALGQESKAYLVEKEERVSADSRFVPVSVIIATDSDQALTIAGNQLGLKSTDWPYLRKGNEAHYYKLKSIPIVETNLAPV